MNYLVQMLDAYQLLRVSIVALCWMMVSSGCQRQSADLLAASCSDGSCCGPAGVHYIFQETVTGEVVNLIGPTGGWLLKFSRPIPAGTNEAWQKSGYVCERTEDKAIAIRQTAKADSSTQFRVWGQLYFGPITLVSVSRYFAIDRIELAQ